MSNESTTFPDAQFGWSGNEVGLGYDAALVALTCPTYGRLFLAGFHYPRNPVGLPRLQQMVHTAEARLSTRPRRRVKLVTNRLADLQQRIAQRQGWLAKQLDKQQRRQTQLKMLPDEIGQMSAQIGVLSATYAAKGRQETSHSRLAQLRRRLDKAQQTQQKAPKALQRVQQAITTHQRRLEQLQDEYEHLTAHLLQLQADNQNNPDPTPIILRIDAGFGTDANITWLIEMGYIIYTKANNAQVARRLLTMATPDTRFIRVGKNAEMTAYAEQSLHNCPYPLTLAVERFHTPDGIKHSALIVYRDDGQMLTLPAWFDFYNGRQLIEAGIKQSNVVFKMHPLKMRSRGGIAIQEQFALFAANFVGFAAGWLTERVTSGRRRFDEAFKRVKTMVRVMANTSAWVIAEAETMSIRFDETSAYPGAEIRLSGTWRARPPILPTTKVEFSNFSNDFPLRCT